MNGKIIWKHARRGSDFDMGVVCPAAQWHNQRNVGRIFGSGTEQKKNPDKQDLPGLSNLPLSKTISIKDWRA